MSAAAFIAAAAMSMPGGAATGPNVEMPGRFFTPSDLQVLVGQTVTWHNTDHVSHSVTATGGAFHSARLVSGSAFEFTFDKPGDYGYYCSIHRSMRGTIHVSSLGLTGPTTPQRTGAMAMLDVLAPADAGDVTLERIGDGDSAVPVETVTPDGDGRAMFHVDVDGPARYRAIAGKLTSAPFSVRAQPTITATATRRGRTVTVHAAIAPAQPGATVALKRYVRNRFAYVPVQTTRTTNGTTVTFKLRTANRVALRVGVVKTAGGWSPSDSPLVRVPSVRR